MKLGADAGVVLARAATEARTSRWPWSGSDGPAAAPAAGTARRRTNPDAERGGSGRNNTDGRTAPDREPAAAAEPRRRRSPPRTRSPP
ncbi:hypothetical protein LT493_44235 [Streptomyces tricolor]|nr:hypothetical protein [Streptomyces tricolor]